MWAFRLVRWLTYPCFQARSTRSISLDVKRNLPMLIAACPFCSSLSPGGIRDLQEGFWTLYSVPEVTSDPERMTSEWLELRWDPTSHQSEALSFYNVYNCVLIHFLNNYEQIVMQLNLSINLRAVFENSRLQLNPSNNDIVVAKTSYRKEWQFLSVN